MIESEDGEPDRDGGGPRRPRNEAQNDETDASSDPSRTASGDRNPVLPYPYLHERRPLPIEAAGLLYRPMQIDTKALPEFRQPFVRFCDPLLKMSIF